MNWDSKTKTIFQLVALGVQLIGFFLFILTQNIIYFYIAIPPIAFFILLIPIRQTSSSESKSGESQC